jgi:hypothetical protein
MCPTVQSERSSQTLSRYRSDGFENTVEMDAKLCVKRLHSGLYILAGLSGICMAIRCQSLFQRE